MHRTAGGDTLLRWLPSNDRKKKSKITESLHTLMGSLGKKKGDKIKRALTDFSSTDSEHAVVAGKYRQMEIIVTAIKDCTVHLLNILLQPCLLCTLYAASLVLSTFYFC